MVFDAAMGILPAVDYDTYFDTWVLVSKLNYYNTYTIKCNEEMMLPAIVVTFHV